MKTKPSIVLLTISLLTSYPIAHAEETNPATPAPAPAAAELDYGDYSSSTITTKAWEAMGAKNYTNAKAYAQKCIDMFKDQAVAMQKEMKEPAKEKEEVFKSWALNDVGTCHLILGQALEAEGKGKEAVVPYKFLVENLAFAQCWDVKGWFWKPADAARERLKVLEFEALN